MRKNVLLATLLLSGLHGGFDFGGDSGGCEGGDGFFQQRIEYWNNDPENAVTVGTIPKDLQDIYISLESNEDVDIRLYSADGEKIVHWPDGILNGVGYGSTVYNGVTIEYSGYNGDGTGRGHEYIKITGTTQNDFVMKAFGYKSGFAEVKYSWAGKANCDSGGTPSASGSGDFEQQILKSDTVEVGDIPPKINNLYITLTSEEDVDIQLYDKDDGTKIIVWPDGILHGADKQTTNYKGMEIEWSGYNGDGTGKGHEYIKIRGETTCNLSMKAYGYKAGYARVHYEWGGDVPTTDNTEEETSIFGRITFDKVGANSNHIGLDYSNITQEPARGVLVKLLNQSGDVVQTTTTDENGNYAFENLQEGNSLKVRVYAEMKNGDSWDIKVIDNTNGDAQYVMDGNLASVVAGKNERNLNAPSGWTGNGYTEARVSAPFAILDDIYKSVQKVVDVDSSAKFPPLTIGWSINNVPTFGSVEDGQIGTSHYYDGSLFILGDANSDTDEFDDHVIVHEWGHYFEDKFSRSDSIGGPHGDGDILDIRVAFGEGWGNAWSAIATDDPIYFDTMRVKQSKGFFMDIESETPSNAGWYSEGSIQRILYDIYDSNSDGADTLSLGFKPIYSVLVNRQKYTPAFTSIFSFITELKHEDSSSSDKIDAILESEDISSISNDIYGNSHYTLYSDMVGGTIDDICTSSEYGYYNKLDNHRYIRFSLSNSDTYKIKVKQSDGSGSDPDFVLYKTSPFEELLVSESEVPSSEENSLNLSSGEYILDIMDYNGLSEACFNISVD